MTTITANLNNMWDTIEPWDCSNCEANCGPNVGPMTWANAIRVAESAELWLLSDRAEACNGMRQWACDTGAWDDAETDSWSEVECLALFVQNIASDLREHLNVDNCTLEECVETYKNTDWEKKSDYPRGTYYMDADDTVFVDYYTGC